MAKFLFIYDLLQGRMGEAKARESFLFITTRKQAVCAGWLPSRFSQLGISRGMSQGFFNIFRGGLFPAAMAGIDIAGLLAGARFMDQRLQEGPSPKI